MVVINVTLEFRFDLSVSAGRSRAHCRQQLIQEMDDSAEGNSTSRWPHGSGKPRLEPSRRKSDLRRFFLAFPPTLFPFCSSLLYASIATVKAEYVYRAPDSSLPPGQRLGVRMKYGAVIRQF